MEGLCAWFPDARNLKKVSWLLRFGSWSLWIFTRNLDLSLLTMTYAVHSLLRFDQKNHCFVKMRFLTWSWCPASMWTTLRTFVSSILPLLLFYSCVLEVLRHIFYRLSPVFWIFIINLLVVQAQVPIALEYLLYCHLWISRILFLAYRL